MGGTSAVRTHSRPATYPPERHRGDAAVLLSHASAVQRFCRSQLGPSSDVEDAVQETFVRYLRRSDEEVRNPEAWLIAAARRSCQDVLRQRLRAESDGMAMAIDEDRITTPEDIVLAGTLVRELFKTLAARDVKLLVWLYMEGRPVSQVAIELNISPGNVRVQALRARRRAAQALADMDAGAGAFTLFPWLVSGGNQPAWLRGMGHALGQIREKMARLGLSLAPGPGNFAGTVAVTVVVVSMLALTPGSAPVGDAANDLKRAATSPTFERSGNRAAPGGVPVTRMGGTSRSVEPVFGTGAAPGPVPGALGPITNPGPQDAGFSSLVASPAYPADHTIFASGTQTRGCQGCPVLFVSRDGGTSWRKVGGAGFSGGQILLPPAFPIDGTIFGIGVSGLQRSDDGGETFRTIVPGPTRAAMSPVAPPGGAHIILGDVPLLVYSEADGLVAPGPALPAGVALVDDLAYGADPEHLIVAGEQLAPTASGQVDAILGECTSQACTATASFSGTRGRQIVVSPSFAQDRTLAVLLGGGRTVVSRDGGRTYASLSIPRGRQVSTIAFDGTYATSGIMVLSVMSSTGQYSEMLRSSDRGLTFADLSQNGLLANPKIGAILLLPSHTMLAALGLSSSDGDFGLRCSNDDGQTWGPTC